TGPGDIFTVEVKASPSASAEDVGTITITQVKVRDCVNAPIPTVAGAAASLTIDTSAPTAISDLSAAQVVTGNDDDGTTEITVSFTDPPEGDLAGVEVYRAPYVKTDDSNAYPEYNDHTGAGSPSIPTYPPSAPWALTSVTAGGQTDETTDRGFWYYVAFAKDDCGNVSAVSNMTGGTLNYHLGDVADGENAPESGDNLVGTVDISELGDNYGTSLAHNDPVNYLDVGPTADYSVNALPTTDNLIGFEDLIMFAINYGQVSFTGEQPEIAGRPNDDDQHGQVALEVGPFLTGIRANQIVQIPILIRGDVDRVQGLRTVLSYDGTLLAYEGSEVAAHLDGVPHFFKALPAAGEVDLNLALLGRDTAFGDQGAVMTVRFRALRNGQVAVRLTESTVRDRNNAELLPQADSPRGIADRSVEAEIVLPTQFRLGEARPNPFNPRTLISFDLPRSVDVTLSIYDASGRVVRTLVDEAMPAGSHGVEWDGTDNAGRSVSTGVFFYQMSAGEFVSQKRMTLLK
ncbi:MAG: hypothetical protein GF346_10860, partial [Candidatus Eisenbacteria bacterium]|nr:hypothetical protein [Candidatus Latescibacterota bacterium]MBD3302937.1 hypothetical protein [Candidatus Eisenbacteria bacterium]